MALDSTLLASAAHESAEPVVDKTRLRLAFVEHYAAIWRFLRRMGVPTHSAGDAAQEVFLIALTALGRIVPGSERAFLYGTAARVAFGLRRKAQREVGGFDSELVCSPLQPPDELADQKRAREVLDFLLQRMNQDRRAVLVLFEVEGFVVAEIADILAIPIGTVGSRLRRARSEFQSLLRAYSASFKRARR
jgi:RNA polymerase sigma-70 factor, ECF subfamily